MIANAIHAVVIAASFIAVPLLLRLIAGELIGAFTDTFGG